MNILAANSVAQTTTPLQNTKQFKQILLSIIMERFVSTLALASSHLLVHWHDISLQMHVEFTDAVPKCFNREQKPSPSHIKVKVPGISRIHLFQSDHLYSQEHNKQCKLKNLFRDRTCRRCEANTYI